MSVAIAWLAIPLLWGRPANRCRAAPSSPVSTARFSANHLITQIDCRHHIWYNECGSMCFFSKCIDGRIIFVFIKPLSLIRIKNGRCDTTENLVVGENPTEKWSFSAVNFHLLRVSSHLLLALQQTCNPECKDFYFTWDVAVVIMTVWKLPWQPRWNI